MTYKKQKFLVNRNFTHWPMDDPEADEALLLLQSTTLPTEPSQDTLGCYHWWGYASFNQLSYKGLSNIDKLGETKFSQTGTKPVTVGWFWGRMEFTNINSSSSPIWVSTREKGETKFIANQNTSDQLHGSWLGLSSFSRYNNLLYRSIWEENVL